MLVMKSEFEALRDIQSAAAQVEMARKSGTGEALYAMLDELAKALERYRLVREAKDAHGRDRYRDP